MRSLFSREEPEQFSKEKLSLINFSKFMKLNREEHLKLSKELAEIKTTVEQFRRDILCWFEFDKGSLTTENELDVEKVKAVPDLIKEALTKVDSMSFSQLLEATQVTAPTLSKYLNKMVDEGLVERVKTDRTVLYRLKRRSDG